MNPGMEREASCPSCKTKIIYSPTNPFRPFCSERCRILDLGAWASGQYIVPVSKENSGEQDEESLKSEQDADSEGE